MVHIVGQKPNDAKKNFMFFNVDKPVGAGAPAAKREDILLVQFFLMLLNFRSAAPDGLNNQTTIDQIRAYQSSSIPSTFGVVADGRVSVATGFRHSGGTSPYTIVMLNSQIRPRPQWPLVHNIAGCPAELSIALRQLF